MKKLICLLSAVAICLFAVGCSNSAKSDDSSKNIANSQETVVEQANETYILYYTDEPEVLGTEGAGILGFKNSKNYNMDNVEDAVFYEDINMKELKLQGDGTEVEIPEKINGNTVLFIDGGAFNGCDSIKSVTIPETIIMIEPGAFDDCSDSLVIYGSAGSAAEEFAEEDNITFSALNN